VAIDSFGNVMGDDTATIATDSIEEAWQRLQTSDAYWAGFSGMLIGGLVYSVLLSTFITVITYGVAGVVVMLGGVAGCMGLIGVIGALVFLVFRAISASLDWPLTSRYAAMTAACFTGLLLFFAPMIAIGAAFQSGVPINFVGWGPVVLMSFLQAGAWLGADRDIRKFEQRVAFDASDKVVARKKFRIDIRSLLVCTFWLAGMMSIFGWFARVNKSPESSIYLVLAILAAVFLSLGFSAMMIAVVKSLRSLQKKLFYRKAKMSERTAEKLTL
jgi:hypothetical protein